MFHRQTGYIGWIILAIVAVVGTAVAIGVGVASTPSGMPAPPSGICYTSCALVVETECGTGKHVGACFGWWECPAGLSTPGSGAGSGPLTGGVGAHPCLP